MHHFMQHFNLDYYETHQGRFGAKSIKPTGLILPQGSSSIVRLWSRKPTAHVVLSGLTPDGHFATAGSEKYPADFSEALASLFVGRLRRAKLGGYDRPCRPRGQRIKDDVLCSTDHLRIDPWRSSTRLLWDWPCQGNKILAELVTRCYSASLRQRFAAPQQ